MLRVTLANDFLFCQISSGMIFIIYSRVITRLEHHSGASIKGAIFNFHINVLDENFKS